MDRPATIDHVVETVAANAGFMGRDFGVDDGCFWVRSPCGEIKTDREVLPSSYQFTTENLAGALAIVHHLDIQLTPQALASLREFQLAGRFQPYTFQGTPLVFDVAHNADSVALLAERIQQAGLEGELVAIFGAMKDKALHALVAPLIGIVSHWVLVRPRVERAANVADLRRVLEAAGVCSTAITHCADMTNINTYLKHGEAAIIYGSFYTVGEAMKNLGVPID